MAYISDKIVLSNSAFLCEFIFFELENVYGTMTAIIYS
jgi:hypothetical protein